jgi:hypothetical protein
MTAMESRGDVGRTLDCSVRLHGFPWRAAILALWLLAAAAPAALAQDGGLSVTGRVILDVDSSIVSSTVVGPAGGAAIEFDGRHFGVQAAFDCPASHSDHGRSVSSPSWSALLAVRPWSSRSRARVEVVLLAGMVGVTHRFSSDGIFPAHSYFWPGLGLGTDVVVALGTHLSIVPEVRLFAFPLSDSSGGIIRPAVGVRWTF